MTSKPRAKAESSRQAAETWMTAEGKAAYEQVLADRFTTDLAVWRAAGRDRLTVFEAIEIVTEAVLLPPGGIDLFVATKVDDNGNEVPDWDSTPQLAIHDDGRGTARERITVAFLAFCKAEGVTPRDPVLQWASPPFADPCRQAEFEINSKDFQRFAAAYRLDTSASEIPSPSNFVSARSDGEKDAADAKEPAQLALTTDDVCQAFDKVGMNSLAWRVALMKNRPQWLMACRARKGVPGASKVQSRWYPLQIAKALANGHSRLAGVVPAAELDRAFRRPLLRNSAEAWKQLRADNPAWGD